MIGSLRGKLIDKRPNQVLIEVGGVGYQVQVPLSTFAGLGPLHAEIALLTYTHVRKIRSRYTAFLRLAKSTASSCSSPPRALVPTSP